MYLRLTTRCDMTCAHCCVSATAKGQDMSMETYKQAIELGSQHGCYFVLGGGEPTLHPDFETMLMIAIAESDEMLPLVVTNGSQTKRALLLAKLAKKGVIHAELSQDEYHDPIDDDVVYAFEKIGAIRDNSNKLIKVGRATKLYAEGYKPVYEHVADQCSCDTWQVFPNGKIKQCGCPRSPIVGHVGMEIDGPAIPSECYRSNEYKEQVEWWKKHHEAS